MTIFIIDRFINYIIINQTFDFFYFYSSPLSPPQLSSLLQLHWVYYFSFLDSCFLPFSSEFLQVFPYNILNKYLSTVNSSFLFSFFSSTAFSASSGCSFLFLFFFFFFFFSPFSSSFSPPRPASSFSISYYYFFFFSFLLNYFLSSFFESVTTVSSTFTCCYYYSSSSSEAPIENGFFIASNSNFFFSNFSGLKPPLTVLIFPWAPLIFLGSKGVIFAYLGYLVYFLSSFSSWIYSFSFSL